MSLCTPAMVYTALWRLAAATLRPACLCCMVVSLMIVPGQDMADKESKQNDFEERAVRFHFIAGGLGETARRATIGSLRGSPLGMHVGRLQHGFCYCCYDTLGSHYKLLYSRLIFDQGQRRLIESERIVWAD